MSSQFHHPQRSLQEWFDLITLCRQSGLSDYDWCKNHDIPASSFYNAVSKLRKKAVQLPDSAFHTTSQTLDITSSKQDVVRIDIEPDSPSAAVYQRNTVSHFDNSYTIEISIRNVMVKVSNDVDRNALDIVLDAIRSESC